MKVMCHTLFFSLNHSSKPLWLSSPLKCVQGATFHLEGLNNCFFSVITNTGKAFKGGWEVSIIFWQFFACINITEIFVQTFYVKQCSLLSLPLVRTLQVNLCQKLFFLQNMGRKWCVQKLFWMSETISVHNMFSPGLSLEFSRIELVIQ